MKGIPFSLSASPQRGKPTLQQGGLAACIKNRAWCVASLTVLLVVCAGSLFPVISIAAEPRQETSLNGTWEMQWIADLTAAPAEGAWQPCTVPGALQGTDYKRAWLRRTFATPELRDGARLKLFFGGVKYNSRVLVNGRQVGGCFGGYDPFEVDITDAVRLGTTNELRVGVHDWTGVFSPGRVDFPDPDWFAVRMRPRDKILAPIGGLFGVFGIWDEVLLRVVPAVRVEDLFVRSSVRRKELAVDYTLVNESAAPAEVELRATVVDRDRDALQLPAVRISIPAGGTVTTNVAQRWPAPRVWSHEDPYLYRLRSELSTGDRLNTRFGFREFHVAGHDFYLNGIKLHLLATSCWPPQDPAGRAQIEAQWRGVKSMDAVAFRTHTQPWPNAWYDASDELGLLVIVEGAVWNDDDTYRIYDPVFWDNYARHLQAMIRRHKNHPSVVMWSLENEFFGGRLNDASPAKADLVRLGRLVKAWDPTRPILYESDGDPGGVADVIGLHYPHEYPEYTCWPNEAYWLDQPQDIRELFLNGENQFFWRKNKPLYIGEFLWTPSSDPSAHTIFFGDEAYRNYRAYALKGKAEAWSMAILGYRHFGVSGISPWTALENGPLNASNVLYEVSRDRYRKIAAFCHDYDSRFYAGEKVLRHIEVFNDILEPSDLTLRWILHRQGRTIAEGRETLRLDPADQRALEITVPMPRVNEPTPCTWRVTLDRGAQRAFDQDYRYTVYPAPRLPAVKARIGLYDPRGETHRLLERHGLSTIRVDALSRLDSGGLDVLIIGRQALPATTNAAMPVIGRVAPERAALDAFAACGGRVLVLEQEAYPEGLFDLTLTAQRSTMAFPLRGAHAALRNVADDDMKYWRGDNMVTVSEPPRPARGGGRALVVSGSAAGLDRAPLLERPAGSGCFVFSQLRLVEKYESEPAAAGILGNLIDYLAAYPGRQARAALLGGAPEYAARLKELGLAFDTIDAAADPAAYSLIIARGDIGGEPRWLRAFVEQGGNLYVHRPTSAALAALAAAFNLELELQPYDGPVSRAESGVPFSIAREDLYWLGPHRGVQWEETPRAMGMADGALGRSLAGRPAITNDLQDWRLDGIYVRRAAREIVFATVGTASAELDFPADGEYIFGLRARGTPCYGVVPVALFSLDGQPLGSVSVSNGPTRLYTFSAAVAKGRRRAEIAFVNDACAPDNKEDRNLFIERLLVARAGAGAGVVPLTVPPAAVTVQRGKGRLVVDELRWDTEEDNGLKAARYTCGLLAELGGDFRTRPGTTLECEAMTPQVANALFRAEGGCASLFSNNALSAPFEAAAAGRYTLEITARGTLAEGDYPLVTVSVDRQSEGEIRLTSGNWRTYPLALNLTVGAHLLKLAYTNDAYVPGVADRNLFLDKVVFFKD
jgi:hypothetical protein